MDTYKIDWKDVVHGSFEIEASSSSEALEKFKSISKGELYKKSNWDTDGKEVKVKFIENKDSPFDAYTPNEITIRVNVPASKGETMVFEATCSSGIAMELAAGTLDSSDFMQKIDLQTS